MSNEIFGNNKLDSHEIIDTTTTGVEEDDNLRVAEEVDKLHGKDALLKIIEEQGLHGKMTEEEKEAFKVLDKKSDLPGEVKEDLLDDKKLIHLRSMQVLASFLMKEGVKIKWPDLSDFDYEYRQFGRGGEIRDVEALKPEDVRIDANNDNRVKNSTLDNFLSDPKIHSNAKLLALIYILGGREKLLDEPNERYLLTLFNEAYSIVSSYEEIRRREATKSENKPMEVKEPKKEDKIEKSSDSTVDVPVPIVKEIKKEEDDFFDDGFIEEGDSDGGVNKAA